MTTRADAQDRIEELREELLRHDRLYYVENSPEISDSEYDKLFAELEALEEEHPDLVTPDSPTQRVGAAPVSELETVEHVAPMLSLNAVREADEIEAFLTRVRNRTDKPEAALFAEPKFRSCPGRVS